jgi:hypothetical protein
LSRYKRLHGLAEDFFSLQDESDQLFIGSHGLMPVSLLWNPVNCTIADDGMGFNYLYVIFSILFMTSFNTLSF